MFGFLCADKNGLDEEKLKRYKSLYCGLCRVLREKYGLSGGLSLTYDTVFLILILNSVYGGEEESGQEKCFVHPAKIHPYTLTDFTEYGADMNIILSYLKCEDDRKDEGSVGGYLGSKILKKDYMKLKEKYPRQTSVAESCMQELSEIEKRGETSPDAGAQCFGSLMSEFFVTDDKSPYADSLRKMSYALGQFIYLCDAFIDFKSDLIHKRYNPLVCVSHSNFDTVLSVLLSDCTTYLSTLPIEKDKEIIDNILFSGVWTKYRLYTSDKKQKGNSSK